MSQEMVCLSIALCHQQTTVTPRKICKIEKTTCMPTRRTLEKMVMIFFIYGDAAVTA
jgi:hypothetical protein